MFNAPTQLTDPSGEVWSWPAIGVGALIGTVVSVGIYVGTQVIKGRPITWGGLAGAAIGGAASGAVAGALVGALAGDPSGIGVIGWGVIGGVSGAAGGFTESIVTQAIDQGQINWNQVGVDTAVGGAVGATLGLLFGCGKVLLRPRQPVRPPGRPTTEPPASQRVERITPPSQYPRPPADPTQPPGPDWEWRGRGPVGSERGSWYNPKTRERLHPNLEHEPPIGPHWDYRDAQKNWWRIYHDGRIEPKN